LVLKRYPVSKLFIFPFTEPFPLLPCLLFCNPLQEEKKKKKEGGHLFPLIEEEEEEEVKYIEGTEQFTGPMNRGATQADVMMVAGPFPGGHDCWRG
jgi:hypothetical protein